jgi:hypothetical protein
VTVFVVVGGSDYLGTRAQLAGCGADVDATVRLHQELGHQVEWLTQTEFTYRALVDRLGTAFKEAGPDDLVWFKASCHGTETRDLDGDENDPWDSALVPDDAVRRGAPLFTDDDLFEMAAPAHARGVRGIAELDACLSGEFHRATFLVDDQGQVVGVRYCPPAWFLPTHQVEQAAALFSSAPRLHRLLRGAGALALSACKETQLAQEYPIADLGGQVRGAASYWSEVVLRNAYGDLSTVDDDALLNYRDWWASSNELVNDPSQILTLGGTSAQKRWLVARESGRR